MTPPGGSDGNGSAGRSHLRLVDPLNPAPAADPGPSSDPPSHASRTSSPDATPLPTRFADLSRLDQLVQGGSTATPYEYYLGTLGVLANPTSTGGYDVTFRSGNRIYRLTQEAPNTQLQLTVTEERAATPSRPAESREIIRIQYLPDGRITSTDNLTPHASPQASERTHHNLFRGIVNERSTRMILGNNLYKRLRTSLEALNPRFSPETHSAWYEHFVVFRGKVYTFRIGNLMGLDEITKNPQLNQVDIFEQTETGRTNILTVSASGENNYQPESPLRQPLTLEQSELLEKLIEPLESARVRPEFYQNELGAAMRKVEWMRELPTPTIRHSVDVRATLGSRRGLRGEPILEIRSGWDLLRNFHPWASHRWENPDKPGETRSLSPRLRLSVRMSRELLRWGWDTFAYWGSKDLRNPRQASDWLNLHLFPEGGDQLNIYRYNKTTSQTELFDILIGDRNGPHWRASREIDRLKGEGQSFSSRLEALQAAVARRNHPLALEVSEAPRVDLDRIIVNSDGTPREIRDATTAWQLIQEQLPEGIQPRVRSTSVDLAHMILPTPGAINRIDVDFRESQPPLNLTLVHNDIPSGEDSKVRRVEVIMRRGDDIHTRVFEDGQYRPHLTRDVFRRMILQAQEGRVPRSMFTLGIQAIPRLYGYYKNSGATYGLSYFASLPLILGYERLIYSPAERQLIGTPSPRLSLDYFFHDFSVPFMTLSTASGIGGVLVDGAYNMGPGLARTFSAWSAGANLFQAYRNSKLSFFNPSPVGRPIGASLFRGFLQRAVPLFFGLAALDRLHYGSWMSPMLWNNLVSVGGVSAGSALLLRGLYASERASGWAIRAGLVESAGAGSQASRFGLTFRGGVAVAALELLALGIWGAHQRRGMIRELERNMRSSLGTAMDRRNELLSRLEHGEEVRPSLLIAADQDLRQTQAAYRRFLELDERRTGTGHHESIELENDFQDEYDRFDAARRSMAELSSGASLETGMGRLENNHETRLTELRGRYDEMESELRELYTRYGARDAASPPSEESLRDFLTRSLRNQSETAAASPTDGAATTASAAVHSPIDVNSPQARTILEQLRWKAAQDPASVLWSPERRASYILHEFRGYRIHDANGGSHPWRREDALAFLGEVQQANMQATGNMEESLTLPREQDHFDTSRLEALMREESSIRQREALSHTHAQAHGRQLAGNIPDFDRQMAEYYRITNERTAVALERFVDPAMLAAVTPSSETNTAVQ